MNNLKIIAIVLVCVYLLGGLLLYLVQDQLIFLPEPLEKDYRYNFDHPFEEINLTMEDGAVINMLHFQAKKPKGLIVYFHGNAGNLSRWGEVAIPFASLGYSVLISDYRGYGKSTGKRSEKKLLSDADAIYAYAKRLHAEDQIILFGRSLGSAFASHLGGKNNPRLLLLETPFYSLTDVAKSTVPIYPAEILLNYSFKSHQYLKEVNTEVFIFHGTNDVVVPYESGMKLRQSIGAQAQLITIEGGHHNDLSLFDDYWIAMENVLQDE